MIVRGSRLLGARLAALTLVLLAAGAAPALGAEVQATPASVATAFSAARAGDTIVLADGSYGTFRGAAKSGVVTIKAASGATASMSLQFSSAANLVFDGLRFSNIEMDGSTHDITVRNSTITGQTVFRTGELQNSDILFDRNVHGAWDKCSGCGEGRVFLPERTSQPSGITIQNSRLGPAATATASRTGPTARGSSTTSSSASSRPMRASRTRTRSSCTAPRTP
jgi:hypothetical protein